MSDDIRQAHSTLEVAPQQHEHTHRPYGQHGVAAYDSGKQVASTSDPDKQHWVDGGGIEAVPDKNSHVHNIEEYHVPARRKLTRKRILLGGAIGLVVIVVAAVLGGVFGSRHHDTAAPVQSSPITPPTSPTPVTIPVQRNIAAVSFVSKSINNTRVYFQDDAGQITEAANSVEPPTWKTKRIDAVGKNGSAIAAAVSRPGFPLEVTIIYVDVNNLIHDITYVLSKGSWTPGALSGQGYIAMSNSSLSAMYNQCSLCANTTIIAFQDTNGFVQIGNLTSGGWTLTQLGQDLDPQMETGLALQPFYLIGRADQINLYHQTTSLNMSLASWIPGGSGVNGWSLNVQTYNTIPAGSTIAAASSSSNVSSGFESWIEVLSLSDTGVRVNTWSGATNDWLQQDAQPSVMANSTSSDKVYGSLAMDAGGNAFAVVKQAPNADAIEVFSVADDIVDWNLVGNVDLDGAWG